MCRRFLYDRGRDNPHTEQFVFLNLIPEMKAQTQMTVTFSNTNMMKIWIKRQYVYFFFCKQNQYIFNISYN